MDNTSSSSLKNAYSIINQSRRMPGASEIDNTPPPPPQSTVHPLQQFSSTADTLNILVQQFGDTMALIQEMRTTLQTKESTISSLTAEISNLSNKVRAFEIPHPQPPLPPPSWLPAQTVRIAMPDKFSGDRTLAHPFYTTVKNYFLTYPGDYTSDEAKVSFLFSLLSGNALIWADSYFRRPTAKRTDWHAFKKAFIIAFADANAELRACTAIIEIEQANLPISTYVEDFRS
jgi:hypothetical protein